jgi:insertion element IS1 protein InsB
MTGYGGRLWRTYSVNALWPRWSLLSAFEVVVWMTDGWPLYESRLKGELHVISKRYTQRIERHNLNLRQHLARLGRKSLSFSKSVELHDKVIGHYLNIKHYQ